MSTSPSHSPIEIFPTGEESASEIGRPHGQARQADRLLTVDEVSAWLGVSKAWVYDHTTRKKPFLPCVRLGEITRFRREEIERFIQENAKSNGSA